MVHDLELWWRIRMVSKSTHLTTLMIPNQLRKVLGASLKSLMLINQVQVRQWVIMQREQESKKRKPGPILKFRNLYSTIDTDILPEIPGTMASACLEPEAEPEGTSADAGWLDGDNAAVEEDPDYLTCNGDSLVSRVVTEEEANLGIPRLLDLLLDKPLELPSSTKGGLVEPSGHSLNARVEPVDWSFQFP
ncbi:hypothetical protein EV363DRAFT_1396228 [Boletus edulis]|nr:hypothetical protein EV363DRAFT_1396228 [Boletus edulis]